MAAEIELRGSSSSSSSQVRVQLTTRDEDLRLPEDIGAILVSTGLRRVDLSTLVNNVLNLEKRVPLEFLINGVLLRRSTIDEFLTSNGISAETTLGVEYVRAVLPPIHVTTFQHDDWISSIDVMSNQHPAARLESNAGMATHTPERILSASYDGLLRIWNSNSELLATSCSADAGGHSAAIKVARFLTPTKLVSASGDRSIRLWSYNEQQSDPQSRLTPVLELFGHKSSIDSIDVHSASSRLISGSSDHVVGFWSTKKSDAPTAPATLLPNHNTLGNKRRKVNPSKSSAQRGPLLLLAGHSNPVSAVRYAPGDATVAHSVSWDHTLRTWDLTTGASVDTRSTSHPLLSLCSMNQVKLLAAGSSARHITLVDPRVSATTVASMTLRGHTNAVVALAADPDSAYKLLSGSHDGTCKIWDIRAGQSSSSASDSTAGGAPGSLSESVYTIFRSSLGQDPASVRRLGGEGVKVFDVCWDRNVGIVSAGEDKVVQINRAQ